MNMRKGLAVLALAVAGAVASAAPASAAPSTAQLNIVPSQDFPGYYDVYVFGHVHTTAYATSIGMRLKGDDPWFNDDLGVSVAGTAYYGDFSLHTRVWRSALNEDPEGRDEVFAHVSASNGWSADTNNVNNYF